MEFRRRIRRRRPRQTQINRYGARVKWVSRSAPHGVKTRFSLWEITYEKIGIYDDISGCGASCRSRLDSACTFLCIRVLSIICGRKALFQYQRTKIQTTGADKQSQSRRSRIIESTTITAQGVGGKSFYLQQRESGATQSATSAAQGASSLGLLTYHARGYTQFRNQGERREGDPHDARVSHQRFSSKARLLKEFQLYRAGQSNKAAVLRVASGGGSHIHL